MKKIEPKRVDEQLMDVVVERMKALRKEHKYTQEFVIERTKLNISQFEARHNHPSLVSLAALCRFYNITLEEFFAGINYPPKE